MTGSRKLLKKLGNIPFLGLIAYYLLEIRAGYKLYSSICGANGEDIRVLFCPHTGTGDVYNIGRWFTQYLRENGITKYTFIYSGDSEKKVGKLFGINGEIVLRRAEMLRMNRFLQFVGPSNTKAIQLHHYPLPPQASVHTERLEGLRGLTFYETFKRVTMGMAEDAVPEEPRFEVDERIEERFDEYDLIPGKTVILGPYSASAFFLPMHFWENLVDELLKRGFTVATNCGSEAEMPVKGTVPLSIEYRFLKSYLEYAGLFIGTRSGLCDIVSSINCKKIVLAPYGKKNLPWLCEAEKLAHYFELSKEAGSVDLTELFFDETENLTLMQTVLDQIE